MKKTILIVYLLLYIILFSINAAANDQDIIVVCEKFINYLQNGQFIEAARLCEEKSEELRLNWKDITDNFGDLINYQMEKNKSKSNTVETTLAFEKQTVYMTFFFNEDNIIISTQIDVNPYVEDSIYSKKYIRENKGKVLVQTPEVFELTNIILVMTDFGLKDPTYFNKRGVYYNQIIKHFTKYRNHPLFTKINFSRENMFNYLALRSNSLAYHFNEDKIVKNEVYFKIMANEIFLENIDLIEDFAKVSNFRSFYNKNKEVYNTAIQLYKTTIPVEQMWVWLEEQFPIKYDTYKIIISPVRSPTNNTYRLVQAGFKKCFMFVPSIGSANIGSLEEALLSRALFTEVVHNYVNPTTDKYRSNVNSAIKNIKKWNKQKYHYYQSPYATFNEYVTWGTFLLYAYDHYEQDLFLKVEERVVKQMTFNRAFIRFDHFADFYLELYQNRGNKKISDLYPEIITWFASYSI